MPISRGVRLGGWAVLAWILSSTAACSKADLPPGGVSPPAVSPPLRLSATVAPHDEERPRYVEGQLLVAFDPQEDALGAPIHRRTGARVLHRFRAPAPLVLLQLPEGLTTEQAASVYRADPAVRFAQPNYRYRASQLSADPRAIELWGLDNHGQTVGLQDADINASEGWALLPASPRPVVIGVIDSGVDFTHEDLAPVMWVNPGEIAGNGVDDDGNGYIDDVHGIDATDPARKAPPTDSQGHGSHVAGTIAAKAHNGVGIVGVSPGAQIIACKFLSFGGEGVTADAIRCLEYFADLKARGVDVVATNNSWGGGGEDQALRDAIAGQMRLGILFVAAAGNDGSSIDDEHASPAGLGLPNIISVGASDHSNRLAFFSNWGARSVDVVAPGTMILSTVPGNKYEVSHGTSMAAPHVTGLVALLKAQDPTRDWRAIRNLVLTGGRQVAGLERRALSGRVIRAADAAGGGSMSCSGQVVSRRARPQSSTEWVSVGGSVVLSMVNVQCASPRGQPTVQLSAAPGSLTLVDDGTGADLAAGDGLYTATWQPPAQGVYTVTFPGGDEVMVVASNQKVPEVTYLRALQRSDDLLKVSYETYFRGAPGTGPWNVELDADFDGDFVASGSQLVPGPPGPSDELTSSIIGTRTDYAFHLAAVRVTDGRGYRSPTSVRPVFPVAPYPRSFLVTPDILVPWTDQPVKLELLFASPSYKGTWTLEWDFDAGSEFQVDATDSIRATADGISPLRRNVSLTRSGISTIALRLRDAGGGLSPVERLSFEARCGPPYAHGISVEASSSVEPVTATLTANVGASCAPISRYRWDLDGDGTFDLDTDTPTLQRAFPDNAPNDAPYRIRMWAQSTLGETEAEVGVEVHNAAPVVAAVPDQVSTQKGPGSYPLQVSDPAGAADPLSFSVQGAPSWVTVSSQGELSWAPPDEWFTSFIRTEDFTVEVRDDDGALTAVPVTLRWDLTPPIQPAPEGGGCLGCASASSSWPSGALLVLLAMLRLRALRSRSVPQGESEPS